MEDAGLAAMLLRLAVSMGVVISLMLLAARMLRRAAAAKGIGGRGREKRTAIDVAAIQPVSKAAQIAVVRAAGREMVLGITEHQVTLLHSSIEPRDAVMDLDVGGVTDTTAVQLDPSSARIALEAPAEATGVAAAGTPTWMDALESLRAKTVRR